YFRRQCLHFQHHSRCRHRRHHDGEHSRGQVPCRGRQEMSEHEREEILRAEHISKVFGHVTALRDTTLYLEKGEELGLLADNGAGKSTLLKILTGFQPPSTGTLYSDGKPVELRSVMQARRLGIEPV